MTAISAQAACEPRPDLERLTDLTHAVVGELGIAREDVRLIIDEATYQAGRLLRRERRVDLPNIGTFTLIATFPDPPLRAEKP